MVRLKYREQFRALAGKLLLSFCAFSLSGCFFSLQLIGAVESVTRTPTAPTITAFTFANIQPSLAPGARIQATVSGSYDSYCITKNDPLVSSCLWVTGVIPSVVTAASGGITDIRIWVRNGSLVSDSMRVNFWYDPPPAPGSVGNAAPQAYPSNVYLVVDGIRYCQGAFIGYEYVLTSASCLDAGTNVTVRLGENQLSLPSGNWSNSFPLAGNVTNHPGYLGVGFGNLGIDAAILYVGGAIQLLPNYAYVKYANQTDYYLMVGMDLVTAGWNRLGWAMGFSDFQRESAVRVVTPAYVNSVWASLGPNVVPLENYLGTSVAPIPGLAGGPVYGWSETGEVILVGIISDAGTSAFYGDYPIMVRVSDFSDWIEFVTAISPHTP